MKRSKEKGSALIITLILVFVLSVMGVSLMFLSQSETWSSFNYRLMTQSRYGAESGLNVAANFIMNNYTAPAAAGADLLANYDLTKSPVQYNGSAVVLSSNPSVNSNYPVAGVVTAFQTAMNTPGQITAGTSTVNYNAYATLLSMGTITTPSGDVTVQTWQVTSDGSINGVKSGLEEVTAVMERQVTTANTYAAFAVAATCGALNFVGNASTNSYDSSALVGGAAPSFANYDGNVGSNGNLNENGNVVINGTMSTPRTGVGSCSAGNVDAWTSTGKATVTGGLIELPQTVSYTLPAIPAPPNSTDLTVNGGGKSCSQTISPGTYGGNISISSGCTLYLNPGVYNINSISEAGSGMVQILPDASGKYQPVVLNVTGANQTIPVDLSGGGFANPSYIAGDFTINYNGTGTVKLVGGSGAAGVVYAPNATVQLSGNADFYGSFIGATIQDNGNGAIHYDRSLQKNNNAVSNYQLTSFSWTRF